MTPAQKTLVAVVAGLAAVNAALGNLTLAGGLVVLTLAMIQQFRAANRR